MTDGPDSPNFEGVMRWQVEGVVERASLELFGLSHEGHRLNGRERRPLRPVLGP